MLASLNSRHDQQQLESKGFTAALAKPVRRREWLSCAEQFLASEWQGTWAEPTTRGHDVGADAHATSRCLGKVLLVEDNAVNQKVAARFLERLGYDVKIAGDGAQAVKAYEQERFDII
jgi:two-component system sensor histidine kinase/response regulator